MKRIILYIVLLFCAFPICAEPLLDRADSAYINKDYMTAVKLYEEASRILGVSTELYYNLGNAYYRSGKLGQAILNYERALHLDPANSLAKKNLEIAKTKTIDKIPDKRSFLTRLADSVVYLFDANTWAVISVIVFFLILGSTLCYLFIDKIIYRKIGFFGGIALIFVEIIALVISFISASHANNHNYAIIMIESAELSATPKNTTTSENDTAKLHEGTKVEIIDSVATPNDSTCRMWYNVKINDVKAWIKSNDVEKI